MPNKTQVTQTRDEIKIVDDDIKLILSESVGDYEQRTGKILQPAHIERSIIQTYSYREYLVKKGINEAFVQTFPQFAIGVALDLCGEPMGCYRLENQAARCVLRFATSDEHDLISIPKGTKVGVSEEIYFSTLVDAQIRPTERYIDVEAVANIKGFAGDGWQVGQVKTLKTDLDTQAKVTVSNIEETQGGIDVESDDEYRKRILLAPEAFTTCGTVGAYEYHTRSVSPYIVDVDISTPQGGTVRIAVLTKNGLPNSALLKQIKDYVASEKRRTLCDTVEVVPAQEMPYQVIAQLDLLVDVNEKDVLANAKQSLTQYLSARTQKMGLDIIPLDIQTALKVAGVYNVRLTEPNLTEVLKGQWANCTSISLTANSVRFDG